MWFWICRSAVAPTDAAEKNCNIGAQLQSITCIKAQRCFGKFTSCTVWLLVLVRMNLFIPSRFWTTYTKFDTLLSALYSDLRKKNLVQVHIYVHGPKIMRWNFLQISQLSIRSGAHKLFRWFFRPFAIFDRNFSKIVAPPSDGNKNCLAVLKGQSCLKNGENEMKIDP